MRPSAFCLRKRLARSTAALCLTTPSLPLLELLRSVFVSLLAVLIAFFAIQWSYQFLAILCIILFQQRPLSMAPPFRLSMVVDFLTSVGHQMMRDMLLTLGGQPFNYLFGQLGGLLGAFLVSGMFHVVELRSFGRGSPSSVLGDERTVSALCWSARKVVTEETGVLRLDGDIWITVEQFGSLSLLGELAPSLSLAVFLRRCLLGSRFCTTLG
ncbi:hypothetical protein J3R83DRAFT_11062 [Lanmaoa asiatica]|nr:hypothetical protein J3R83DRAFT_11062 [Lanmaoa asiatica]